MAENINDEPPSRWFHPQSLLDWSYEIGIIIKGINGTLEIVSGILLLALAPSTMERWLNWFDQAVIGGDLTAFPAANILRMGSEMTSGRYIFALTFLLPHGIVKVGLVLALLRQKLWAYPWALVALVLFLIYQIYLLVVHQTFMMGFLVVLDVVIIWLVWREWQKVIGRKPDPTA